jgi:hypothetical protein
MSVATWLQEEGTSMFSSRNTIDAVRILDFAHSLAEVDAVIRILASRGEAPLNFHLFRPLFRNFLTHGRAKTPTDMSQPAFDT